MGGEDTNRFQFLRLDDLDFVVRGVIEDVGPPDEHGRRNSRLIEGHVVTAPHKSEGSCDTVNLSAGLKLSGHGPLPVYLQRLARADHVQVEHGNGAGEWVRGVLHVVPGAQQPLLLAVPGSKEDAAGGVEVLRLPQPGDLQHRSNAGPVVVGPVHDSPIRLASQVVIVSADDDNLVAVLRVGARKEAQDVAGLDLVLFLNCHGDAHGRGEGRGGEAQAQIVQRVVGADEQVLRHGLGDQVGGDGLHHPGGLAVAPAPERLPLPFSVQQQQPADPVLNGLTVDLGVAGVAAQDDFADHIEAGIGVVQTLVQPDDRPFPLPRAEVAAGESAVVGAIDVGAGERFPRRRCDGEHRRLCDLSVGHGEGLEVSGVWPGRLQAVFGKASGDVVTGCSPAGGAGLAAAQFVAGQVHDVLQRLLLVEHTGEGSVVGGRHQRPHSDLRRVWRRYPLRVAGGGCACRRPLELQGGRLSSVLGHRRAEQAPQIAQNADLDEGQDDDQGDEDAVDAVGWFVHRELSVKRQT